MPLKADTVTKDYVKDAGAFADISNYYIYGGRQVILPEQLVERDSTKISLPYSAAIPVQKFRDMQKLYAAMTDGKMEYVLCGAENQGALLQATELLRQQLAQSFPIPVSHYFVIDSFPLPVCKFGCACYCRSFHTEGANYGRCPSKKETYFGFKVHALITLEGYISAFEITPASVDDREGLRDFAENHFNLVIPGDKGYTGEALSADMQNKGICLMSLNPSDYKKNCPTEIRRLIFRFRRRVKTVFSQLSKQLNAERVSAKSFRGLYTRLQNEVLGQNLCMAFNSIFLDSFRQVSNSKICMPSAFFIHFPVCSHLYFSFRYASASLKKPAVINSIINPTGKAAIIETDCRLYMEFSAKIRAIGNSINITAQKARTFLSGSVPTESFL